MVDFFQNIFSAEFMPHGQCMLWQTDIVWLHLIADVLIALAYYSIPIALLTFVRKRRDISYSWVPIMFAIFILACGTSHLASALTLWEPVYRLEGVIKAFTALVSIVTAVALWPLLPRALKVPSTNELIQLNAELHQQIEQRQQAQLALKVTNNNLQKIVDIRTAELQKLNSELEEKSRELTRSNAELEQFAYVVSHDLKQPLRSVSGFAERLEAAYAEKLDEKARQYIKFITDGSARMRCLIDDLLVYSRIGQGNPPLESVDLNETLEQVLVDLQIEIEEHGASIRHDPLPVIHGDSLQMRRVLQNLIGNAIKYRGEAAPEIAIQYESGDDGLVFSIQDNGIGFDKAFSQRIFKIFQRLHTQEEYSGTGIGLAICRKIIENHGGRIWADSADGQGATFYFSLPVQIVLQPEEVVPQG